MFFKTLIIALVTVAFAAMPQFSCLAENAVQLEEEPVLEPHGAIVNEMEILQDFLNPNLPDGLNEEQTFDYNSSDNDDNTSDDYDMEDEERNYNYGTRKLFDKKSEKQDGEREKKYPSCKPNMTVLQSGDMTLKTTTYDKVAGWGNDRHAEVAPAFLKSCSAFKKTKAHYLRNGDANFGKMSYWTDVCDELNKLSLKWKSKSYSRADRNLAAKLYFEENFTPVKVYKKDGLFKTTDKGLFTGYYEITLNGSLNKTDEFIYPIYKRPHNFKAGQRGYSRAEIESGALRNKSLELVWTNSKLEILFLHIQGSGIVNLPNGKKMRIGYHGNNGYEYQSVYKYLENNPQLKKEVWQGGGLIKWMQKNSNKVDDVLNTNPSYIFFKEMKSLADEDGPVGAQEVPLTSERSIAVDRSIFPYGLPVWLDLEIVEEDKSKSAFNRIVVAQDTGSAIKGAIRADVFFGSGKKARGYAERLKNTGSYYILMPNGALSEL